MSDPQHRSFTRQGAGRIDNRVDGSPPERGPGGDRPHLTKDLTLSVEGKRGVKRFTYRLEQSSIDTNEIP